MLDDRVDQLVDEVAKAMTAAPPDASLAQRVSTRIAEVRVNDIERATRWRPWVLVPVASACALVLAVFVARENSVRLKPDATPVTNIAPTTPAASYVERPFQGRGDRERQGLDRGPERAALRREAAGSQPQPALTALAVAPLEVDRLDVQPLVEMDEISISPIAIDRIEISAMP